MTRSAVIIPQAPAWAASIAARPEPGGQHPVKRRRRAAALHVAEDRGAGLESGPLLDLLLEPMADPAEPRVPELVALRPLTTLIVPSLGVAPSAATTIEK